MGLFDILNRKQDKVFKEKEIIMEIDGPGIAFYSPKTVSFIKKDYDFLNNDFMKPEDIANHVMKCDISAFCTGSPGKYILKIREGNPTLELLSEFDIITRLGIIVKDNKINFVDLFWLSSWDTEIPDDQVLKIDNGKYYITSMTKLPESKKYGDNQIIYMYFDKTRSMPRLKYKGAPMLFREVQISMKEKYAKLSDEVFLEKIITKMEKSIEDSEIDELIMNDSIEMIKERNIKNKAIEPLFELMERNPLVSFGNPGAIVHYLETIDSYEEYLINSIKNSPSLHTLWMLNRCINEHTSKEKEFLEVMKEVSLMENIDIEIRDCAKNFLEYQEGNK